MTGAKLKSRGRDNVEWEMIQGENKRICEWKNRWETARSDFSHTFYEGHVDNTF